jgi:nicotinamide-nucleotide amidase
MVEQTIFPAELLAQADALLGLCRRRQLTVAVAESCTGGLICAALTEIPGASDVFTHGFITYANPAKMAMINVPAQTLNSYGAVSEPIARAMAEGARRAALASLAVSVTGIAGPGGETPGKAVGLVHIACAAENAQTLHEEHHFQGTRGQIRLAATSAALALLMRQANAV